MDHTLLLATGTGIEDEPLNSHGRVVFGALPQIKRLVITAQRAGIKKFTIITDKEDYSLRELLNGDKRITSELVWSDGSENIELDSDPLLLLQSNVILTPEALSDFMCTHSVNGDITVLVDTSHDAWIKTSDQHISDLFTNGGRAVGAFIASGNIISKYLLPSMSLNKLIKDNLGGQKLKFKPYNGKYWMRLTSDPNSPKKAQEMLFNYVGKTATGWLSRNINSKFSLPTSRQLIKTPLTPNMISVLINIIGSICGVFYAIGYPVVGALCMHTATILDRCDGEVARVKLMETKRGQWVDTISDQFTVLSFLIGAPLGYYFSTGKDIALILGGINISIFIFFVIWSFYFLRKYTDSGSLVAYFDVEKLYGEKKESFVHKLLKIVRPMGRRNVYSFGFLMLAIFAGYPVIVWISTIGLILFLIHQLEDIIKLRNVDPKIHNLR